jgi:hypothetical protein
VGPAGLLRLSEGAKWLGLYGSVEEPLIDARGPLPARHAAEGKEIVDQWLHSSPHERDEYRRVVQHFGNENDKVHNADEDRKDRTSRYKSPAMTAKLEASRLARRDKVNCPTRFRQRPRRVRWRTSCAGSA